ncbi:MAG: HEAT repeat domain-containing protein [Treponema sp.]|nr:HEAT repeat domain-containing protein [Treponema sp.]
MMYRKAIVVFLSLFPLFALFPQDSSGMVGVESSYSPDYANIVLIREQSRMPDRNVKMAALSLIEEMLEGDNGKDEEIFSALEFLSLEGVVNKERLNGVIVNSYPSVRLRAAKSLGSFGGNEAHRVLMQMLRAETETIVLTETVRALAKIGIAPEDEAVLNNMMRRFDVSYPDNALALAFLDAYQGVGEQRRIGLAAWEIILHISQSKYHSLVRKKAQELLRLQAKPVR